MATTKGAGAGGRTRNGAPSSEEWQVWQSVCSYLRTLDSARGKSVADYGRLSGVSDQNIKQADSLVDSLVKSISEEQHAIDGALERISILTSLRQATEGSATSGRRKRKVEETSPSPSADDVETLGDVKRRASDARKARNSISAGNTKRGAGEVEPHRAWLTAQLPLKPGRKVAFCEPRATAAAAVPGTAAVPEEGEVWILATVTGSIANDKLRYVVQDAEEEGTNGPTWNTTLDSIAPLPISLDSLPPEDYVPGSRVLALYPDTSCFYFATVKGGGPHLGPGTARSKLLKREGELLHAPYSLMFDDDGGDIKQVPAYLVVEHP